MNHYTQINYDERVIIAELLRKKKSYYAIAKWLGRKYDTIKNEIERNSHYDKHGNVVYHAKRADKLSKERRKESKRNKRIIENNSLVEEKITHLIVDNDYSPEQIVNRYDTVSHQTIYNWIYRIEDEEKRKNIIAPKTMINERPDEINNRERCGDFEGDTVHLSRKERLYTLVDRKSRYTIIKHITNGYAEYIHQETIDIFKECSKTIHSITYDNGKEFSFHDLISLDTGIKIYFAFPYHSWKRGTNENTNGLIRQYFPKGIDHGLITKEDIIQVEEKLNHRPRKCLGWLTPHEVFIEKKKPEDFQVQALI